MQKTPGNSGETAAAGARPRRGAGRPPTAGGMAQSVTRHNGITGPQDWELLAAGIDTLDLGLYVDWRGVWPALSAKLEDGKQRAMGTEGVPCGRTSLGESIILPAGKRRYAWHLQWPALHLWIADRDAPAKNGPNVLCSINSHTLWEHGLAGAVALVERLMVDLRGKLLKSTVSRVDLCADFRLDVPLTLDFLRAATVAKSPKRRPYLNGDRLETWYVGQGGGAIQVRIYDKALEINRPGGKSWMWDVWGIEPGACVWRVELQVRRRVLRQYGLDSLKCLGLFAGGIWLDLLTNWCSLRLADDSNTTRRTVHPWWQAVQQVAQQFGKVLPVGRCLDPASAGSLAWYRSHVGGCLAGYAALKGLRDLQAAIAAVGEDIEAHWASRNWAERFVVESVRRGMPVEVNDGIPI